MGQTRHPSGEPQLDGGGAVGAPHAAGSEAERAQHAAAPPQPPPQPGPPPQGVQIVIQVPERPQLAPNIELSGQMQESGFKDRQWLIQRDGHFIQVSELLYRIAEQANGERTLEEIAAGVTESTDWIVSGGNVHQLIQT